MPEFQEQNREEIVAFLRKYSLGMLTGTSELGKICATHVPFLIDDHGDSIALRAHFMRKTEYWNAFKANPEALIAFTGPDAPVLASWNSNLVFGGTWNYMAVHVRGRLEFLPEEQLVEILRELKNRHEIVPEAMFEHLPADYVSHLLPAIEGFKIEVQSMSAVFKLSQNRDETDFDSTVSHLREAGGESALVADEMLARRGTIFDN